MVVYLTLILRTLKLLYSKVMVLLMKLPLQMVLQNLVQAHGREVE